LTSFAGIGPFARLGYADVPGAGSEPRFYVFAYFAGGWDTLLGLDPRDPIAFNEDNLASTRIQPAYDLIAGADLVRTSDGTMFGPFIGSLADHWEKLAVVRGMSMETLTHEVGRRRFLTGKAPSGLTARGSSAATWLASVLGAEESIPNLTVRVESYNRDQPSYANGLSVDSVPDLIEVLRAADPALTSFESEALNDLLSSAAECEVAQRSELWQVAEAARVRAEFTVAEGYADLFAFQADTPEMQAIRAHYGIGAGVAALRAPEAQAAMAGQAIMSGISRVVSFEAASGLDTHFDNWSTDQGPSQQRGFDAVARLVEDLAAHEYLSSGNSWLDYTTIVGFSEFGRTAMLNTNEGRDHSLTNSCFLLGGRVRGQQIIGASSDVGMSPVGVDLATGARMSAGGEVVRPEHVIQALFRDAGIEGDPADLRVDPLSALFS